MPALQSSDLTVVVHLVGFLTGIVLYAMLGVMLLRTRASRPSHRISGGSDRIALATAGLGLVWNCGALVIYGLQDLGVGHPQPWLTAVAFSALGFLPAVVVHSAVQSFGRFRWPWMLVRAAYALSGAAAALQFYAAMRGAALPYRPALLALTTGYAVIIAVLAALSRGQPGWRRALAGVALAAFAVMALHLSVHVEGADSWVVELVGHHASLPLALVILYQDYRFALADIFLKRALTLVSLVAVAAVLYLGVVARHLLPLAVHDHTDPRATSGILALWIATAVLYPLLRRGVDAFVDRLVLRRVDYNRVRAELLAAIGAAESPEAVLDTTTRLLAPALTAERITWSVTPPREEPTAPLVLKTREGRQSAIVRILTTEPPCYALEIGPLAGGRRLLSDDLAMLERAALVVARRIDAMRVTQERVERSVRESEILQLATESELRALRAQLNPHFLFNALNTIGYLMKEAPERALDTLYRLTGLLRGVLRRSDGTFVTLGEELELVEAYLAIERARFEERLQVTIDVPDPLRRAAIPPLLLQPLVENAIKHGISPRLAGGAVTVRAHVDGESDETTRALVLAVVDTGVGSAPEQLSRRRASGIGLANVERRLEQYYDGLASLTVRSAVDVGTTVEIRLPLALTQRTATPALAANG
jgi:signal transduction histidine kinase